MKIKLLFLFIFSNAFLYGQLLSIDQTISYLNSISKKISNSNYDSINLNSGGFILVNRFLDFKGTIVLQKEYSFHYSDVQLINMNESKQKIPCCGGSLSTFCLNCSGECITETEYYGSGLFMDSQISKYEKPLKRFTICLTPLLIGDEYSKNKVINAYTYLFALLKESGKYERIDNDPFAPKNFSSTKKSIDISSTTQSNISEIALTNKDGVYTVPVKIGSKSRNFIIDSGAGEVQLSFEFLQELIKEGVITKDDILPDGLYKLANGSITICKRIKIKKMKVGNFTVSNVTASVSDGNIPLLLGKSFFDKFKKWSIDNTTITLHLEK